MADELASEAEMSEDDGPPSLASTADEGSDEEPAPPQAPDAGAGVPAPAVPEGWGSDADSSLDGLPRRSEGRGSCSDWDIFSMIFE